MSRVDEIRGKLKRFEVDIINPGFVYGLNGKKYYDITPSDIEYLLSEVSRLRAALEHYAFNPLWVSNEMTGHVAQQALRGEA